MASGPSGFQVAERHTRQDIEGGRSGIGERGLVSRTEDEGKEGGRATKHTDAPTVFEPGTNLLKGSGRGTEGRAVVFLASATESGEGQVSMKIISYHCCWI